jgi:poly(3-hydroxybutyrate) depolymerase
MKSHACLFLAPLMACVTAFAGEEVIKDSQGMDCHVYTPDPVDTAKIYQFVVGVHGARGNGKGAAGMADWAERGDVIVIGPSFDTKNENPFQNGNGVHAEKLIALFESLGKRYKLRDKMFLHGFSAGSQFVHRFAMNHPKQVCGVSAHSGGTWATDGYGEINSSAKKIPFAISCGEKDAAKSTPDAPFTRIEWYGRFRDEIEKKKFRHIAASWPGVGHSISPGAWDLARQCFQLATGLPGKSATEEAEISAEWKNLDGLVRNSPLAKSAPPAPATVPEETLRAAFAKADAEEIPADKLIAFMRRYPPVLWKDKPGSAKLLEQCRNAAENWLAAAKANGLWQGKDKEDFLRHSEGLGIETDG